MTVHLTSVSVTDLQNHQDAHTAHCSTHWGPQPLGEAVCSESHGTHVSPTTQAATSKLSTPGQKTNMSTEVISLQNQPV